jgi:hypothetical protein
VDNPELYSAYNLKRKLSQILPEIVFMLSRDCLTWSVPVA